jgi:hypothetical protein
MNYPDPRLRLKLDLIPKKKKFPIHNTACVTSDCVAMMFQSFNFMHCFDPYRYSIISNALDIKKKK